MKVADAKPVFYIASDHAGYSTKQTLKKAFPEISWVDMGSENEASVDYPDYSDLVAKKITQIGGRGVLVCGSGQGMAIRANRYPAVRAALCWTPEVARLSRQHNDANVLCLSGRLIDPQTNAEIFRAFLETPFEGGRHTQRVEKLGR